MAAWRTDANGVPVQTDAYLKWFNAAPVGGMALARAEGSSQRFYSFSAGSLKSEVQHP